MDVYSVKRSVGGNTAPRKGYKVAPKNATNERDLNSQFCNRIGCSGRIKYSQNTKVGTSDKAKCSKPTCHVNEITAKPSKTSSVMTSSKKPQLDSKRKLSSKSKFDQSESSSLSSESESSSSSPNGYKSNSRKNLGKVIVTDIGTSSSVPSNVRPRKTFHQNPGPACSVPSVAKNPPTGTLNSSNGSRNSLRNGKYSSTSNIVQPSYSSHESKCLGKNVMKKRSPEGESSLSSRGRKSTYGISISESGQCSSANGDSCNRRTMNVNTRMRPSSRQGARNSSSLREPANMRPFNIGGQSSTRQPLGNISSSDSRSYSFSSSNDDNISARMPFSSSDPTFSQLVNRNGIAEVLLALERIEQDEELTHEQLLALETSLFLSGLNLYDQHRDMRMDIDNMSYEDLLALEERMGTVSTAVSEEALSKCIKRGTYQSTSSKVRIIGSGENGDDDTKCSICQEEYVSGDDIGKLVECQHGFHETCINQWLRVKNWCPICKAEAHSSSS